MRPSDKTTLTSEPSYAHPHRVELRILTSADGVPGGAPPVSPFAPDWHGVPPRPRPAQQTLLRPFPGDGEGLFRWGSIVLEAGLFGSLGGRLFGGVGHPGALGVLEGLDAPRR